MNNPRVSQPQMQECVRDNTLLVNSLEDGSRHELLLVHGEPLFQDTRLAVDKSRVVVCPRRQGAGEVVSRANVFEISSARTWPFNLTLPSTDDVFYNFKVDFDRKVVTCWVACAGFDYCTELDLDTTVAHCRRCFVTIQAYKFHGVPLRKQTKDILLNDDDKDVDGMLEPPIYSPSCTKRSADWSAAINHTYSHGLCTAMEIDWSSEADQIKSCHRGAQPVYMWRSVVFRVDDDGYLHIGRRRDVQPLEPRSVSKASLRALFGIRHKHKLGYVSIAGINGYFLVLVRKETIWVCSFSVGLCHTHASVICPFLHAGSNQSDHMAADESFTLESVKGICLRESGEYAEICGITPGAAAGKPVLSEEILI